MKTRTIRTSAAINLSLATLFAATPSAWSQNVPLQLCAFNFQGRIYENGLPAYNLYDLQFRLWDAETNGSPTGSLRSFSGVGVSNGYFNVSLDFGTNAFNGAGRWLEMQQRVSGTAPYPPALSRIPILATPYSMYAYAAGSAAVASNVSPGAITAAALAPGSVNSLAIADGSICSADLCPDLLDKTFWRLLGNWGTDPNRDFLGTKEATMLTIGVNDLAALRIIPDNAVRVNDLPLPAPPVEPAESPNILGGFRGNSIHPDNKGATIAGGGSLYDHFFHSSADHSGINVIDGLSDYSFLGSGAANYISGNRCVIVGGHYNRITNGNSCAISGGEANLITFLLGDTNNTTLDGGFIGGGSDNTLKFAADAAVIGGGHDNTVTNFAAFIGAGGFNLAAGAYSAIVGGTNNWTLGESSVVAGGADNSATAKQSSIGGGRGNLAAARASVIAGGQFNYTGVTNDFAAVLGGNSNTNLGVTATVSGGEQNLALGNWSAIPGGRQAVARSHGELAFAAGQLDNPGDAQVSTFVLRRRFNGNSELFLDGNAALQRVAVPNGAVWTLRFQVSAVSVAGANFASYEVSGMVANLGGAMMLKLMDGTGAIVGTARPVFETPGAAGWSATPNITGDGTLRIGVIAGEDVKWCARIDATEVTR